MSTAIVVDDETDITEIFSEYLELKGIKVVGETHNGHEAVELYKKLLPDVVLTDVMMPVYDGFYELRKIREIDPNARIIFVTASLSNGTESKMKEYLPSAIINKPFDIDYVIEVIKRVINGETEIFPTRNC